MSKAIPFCVVALCLLTLCAAPAARGSTEPSPAETLPAAALERLSEHVESLVEKEEIVGGELVVISQGRTVLQRAYGLADLESRTPLETDSVFCIRSMTKPVVGTAVQVLIDEGRLRLDTPVHEILPAFDGTATRGITVEHLLTHTSGLPFTTLSKPLGDYEGLDEVAAEAAAWLREKASTEPGTHFQYSDAGTDVLGAVVARITGEPLEVFLRKRLFEPLGMGDTFTSLEVADPEERSKLTERIPSAYSGGTGTWTRHWKPSDPPIFPFFLASQGLYSTTADYARFLDLWLDGGKVGERRLLSEDAVRRALAPAHPIDDYPRTLDDARPFYGQLWWLQVAEDGDEPGAVRIFGHNGSDGTYAWAWPEHDLLVLFFTQSRGTLAGVGMEALLQTLLVDRDLDHPSLRVVEPAPADLDRLAGLYWDETAESAYYVVKPRGSGLVIERPDRMQWVFEAHPTLDRFVHEAIDDAWVEFVRAEDGSVVAMRTSFGGKVELDPRHDPAAVAADPAEPPLPSVEEVVAKVQKAHGIDGLSQLGLVRMEGKLRFPSRGMEASLSTLFDAERERNEMAVGSVTEVELKVGDRAFTMASTIGTNELEGLRREMALLDHPAVRFGDWRQHYRHVEVLKRVTQGDRSVLLVRVVPETAPGSTMIVDEKSGRLRITDTLALIPGLGMVGVRTQLEDYRDVGGVLLPFASTSEFAHPMIGMVETELTEVEIGVEEEPQMFALP